MRNNYKIVGNKVEIELNRNNGDVLYTKVSIEHLPKLLEFDVKWCLLDQKVNTFYVMANEKIRSGKKRTVRLHRFLLDEPEGMMINHINGNGLDNTIGNLEIVTNQVNTVKRVNKNSNNTSGIRGVTYNKRERKWEVKFKRNYKTVHFGRYKCKKEAERIAKEKFEELFEEELSS